MQHVITTPELPYLPQPSDDREPGCHLSHVIKDIAVTLDPQRFSGNSDGEELGLWGLSTVPKIWLGQAMDHYLGQVIAGREAIRPPAIEKEGVWMTSDHVHLYNYPVRPGLSDDHEDWLVEEIKLTWMSAFQGITDKKYRHWLWQLMAYCWAWETRRGRLRVFYVNGDYRPPTPSYVVHEFVFTMQELEDNWRMIVRHARKRGMVG